MNAIEPGECRAAGAGTSLVAGFCDVIKVIAAGSLQQIAAGGGLVAQLRAGARQQCTAQHRVALPHAGIGRKVAVSNQRADAQAALRRLFDLVERQPVDVDQHRWRLDLQLHQVEQIGAAGNDFRARFHGSGGSAGGGIGTLIGKGFHVGNPAACLMAATMFG